MKGRSLIAVSLAWLSCSTNPGAPDGGTDGGIERLGEGHVVEFAVADDVVCWITAGTDDGFWQDGKVACQRAADAAAIDLAIGLNDPLRIAIVNDHVYWRDDGSVWLANEDTAIRRVALAGGEPELLREYIGTGGFDADESGVYFSSRGRAAAEEGMFRLDLDGSGRASLSGSVGSSLVVNDLWIFFVGGSNQGVNIVRMPKSGGAPVEIWHERTEAIVADDAHLAWYTTADPYVATKAQFEAPFMDFEVDPAIELTASDVFAGMSLHGEHVYVSQTFRNGGGSVARFPVTGGSLETVAPDGATATAADDEFVYWGGLAGGVMRQRLP